MLVLTFLLVLYARQNNKDAMHIYDVVMVREELRDEFSKIENYSFYGRDDNQEYEDGENQLEQVNEENEENNEENEENNEDKIENGITEQENNDQIDGKEDNGDD